MLNSRGDDLFLLFRMTTFKLGIIYFLQGK